VLILSDWGSFGSLTATAGTHEWILSAAGSITRVSGSATRAEAVALSSPLLVK
jgi:hypothetical protein